MEFIWWNDAFEAYFIVIILKNISMKSFTIQYTKIPSSKLIRYTVQLYKI